MGLDERQKAAVKAEREESFLLAVPEKRFLRWTAARLPRWILPDDVTALGVVAALAVAVAYQLSNDGSGWLWAASARGIRMANRMAIDGMRFITKLLLSRPVNF